MHFILQEEEKKEDMKMKHKSILSVIQTRSVQSFTLPPQYTMQSYSIYLTQQQKKYLWCCELLLLLNSSIKYGCKAPTLDLSKS